MSLAQKLAFYKEQVENKLEQVFDIGYLKPPKNILGVSLVYLAHADKDQDTTTKIGIASALEALDCGVKKHYYSVPDSQELLQGDFLYANGLTGICKYGSASNVYLVSRALSDISEAFAQPIKHFDSALGIASLWGAAYSMSGFKDETIEELALVIGAERMARELYLDEGLVNLISQKRVELLKCRPSQNLELLLLYMNRKEAIRTE